MFCLEFLIMKFIIAMFADPSVNSILKNHNSSMPNKIILGMLAYAQY